MRGAPALVLSALLPPLLACARIEPPPGGPPDAEPPRLLGTIPDSLARLPEFEGAVEFQFDEVINEGGGGGRAGTGELDRLVILSPTAGVPEVRWRRTRITVRPEDGWQPNRVYRVELLPGVTDLRRNRSDERRIVTFTTGAPIPDARLEGQVVDWTSSRPAADALIVALLLPDSLPYRGLADSAGRFSLGPLPRGDYLVSGILDQNRNRRADGREAYDTARVRATAAGPAAVGELWAFVHDTTPPRITNLRVGDSLSALIEVAQPLAPGLRLRPADASVVLLPDSSPVPVVSIMTKPQDDSLHAPARPDSGAARPDSAAPGRRPAVPAKPEAVPGRPPLTTQLVLRVGRRWSPGGRYVVTVRNLRNVTGSVGEGRATLVVPEQAAADTAAPDAARAVPDTADEE